MLREFVVGILYTERIVRTDRSVDPIAEYRNELKNPFSILTSHKTVLRCGGPRRSSTPGAFPRSRSDLDTPRPRRSGRRRKRRSIRISTGSPGGIHLVGLFDGEGKAILIAADIGRHNALDRVIGHGLLPGSIFRGRLRSVPDGYPPRWSGSAWSQTSL